jgi:hypothetical protein
MVRKQGCIIAAVLLFGFPLVQLVSQEPEPVFKPYVSNIDAELNGGFIRISWKDSSDARGPVYIYRSSSPIHASSGLPLRPEQVPYGAQSYLEAAEKSGITYYFIAASDDRGKKYTAVMPYTNTLCVVAREIDLAGYTPWPETDGTEAVMEWGEAGDGLEALTDNDRVLLTFGGNSSASILYRSTRPILRQEDLLRAVIISRAPAFPYIDYPVPGIPYYYALISEAEFASGTIQIQEGVNATVSPVEVPFNDNGGAGLGRNERDRVRIIPIPVRNGSAAAPALLSGQAERAARIVSNYERRPGQFQEPVFFMEDMEASAIGENAQLRLILYGSFSALDWEQAGDDLRQFLSIPHSAQVTSRARFYLGQVYYFSGKPREALFEFLASHTHYPAESSAWIDAALTRLVR